jgi:glycine/D-amino acid oxidase-like deaminating enzyme
MISIRKNMNFSYWEHEIWLKNIDFAIIGSGIVGLSAAFHIKLEHPDARVVVLERDFVSFGASTRNAGFACYGSPSEILSDLKNHPAQQVFSTMAMRWKGLHLLRSYIPDIEMDFHQNDGFEIFLKENEHLGEEIEGALDGLNAQAEEHLNFKPYMRAKNEWGFHGVQSVVRIKGEGILHPGKMIQAWQKKCSAIGVEFRFGLSIDAMDVSGPGLIIRKEYVPVKNIVVCTNGFATQLLPGLDVIPARNQVLVTSEILENPWNQSFHIREGYVYLRSIGKRILIGGGRDLFEEVESTDIIADNLDNQVYLKNFLCELLNKKDIKIDCSWSGIMGMGKTKGPIIQKIHDGVFVGVRMGGMGVAIGTWVGKELSELTK